MINHINIIALAGLTLTLVLLLITSIREKEIRALSFSFVFLIGNTGMWLFFIFKNQPWVQVSNLVILILLGLFAFISLLKFHPPRKTRNLSAALPFDERDHMFSRNSLQFHPELAKKYYKDHPEKESEDKKIQMKPELGEPGHLYYDPYYSPFFTASEKYLHRIIPVSKREPVKEKKTVNNKTITDRIQQLCRFYGAVDIGITPLQPHHLYSYAGRWPEIYGKKIKNTHKYAVVIVVAMTEKIMKHAPTLPAILESTRQYVEAAKIASILAEYIRNFGYQAQAHTDGNYETLCVPLAVDSGMGELGRIGIFMHHIYGPCVRLSIVTTDLELIPTPSKSYYIDEFCKICKKCADNCPTQSISTGEETFSRGFQHWSINIEKCFSFWKNIGTDCGFCIAVCPYTKPNTLMHKIVRLYISRNPLNQRIALFFDDLFYGRTITIPPQNQNKIILLNKNSE